jgi:hypothetical protein
MLSRVLELPNANDVDPNVRDPRALVQYLKGSGK